MPEDKLDSQEFYELMQTYRWADQGLFQPEKTLQAFELVKIFIRENFTEKQ